jgi:hypothetical protein
MKQIMVSGSGLHKMLFIVFKQFKPICKVEAKQDFQKVGLHCDRILLLQGLKLMTQSCC